MLNLIEDNSILIIPNNIKEEVIKNIRNQNKNLNIKIFSLEEFINNLTFTYNEETIFRLMQQENVNYNIASIYLNNIKYVDKHFNIPKLDKLYNIKKGIDDYLIKDTLFKKLIKNKKIIIYGYDYITKYQEYVLNDLENVKIIKKVYNNNKHKVYRIDTLENEVIFVAEKISQLIDEGVNINNIFLTNINDSYYTTIKRIFDMYNIPVNLNEKKSIYKTHIGTYFINNLSNDIDKLLNDIKNKFDLNNIKNYEIYSKIINVLNNFYFTNNYIEIKENIINVMKKTYITNNIYKNAVNEIDIKDNMIDDSSYVFLLGFNLNKFPIIIKDEDYIEDNIKPSILETSTYMNKLNNELYYKIISNIKNLTITYKEKHLNEVFYPSLLIDEYNMEVLETNMDYSNYSNVINKIKLTKMLDNLIKFNIKDDKLNLLYSNYNIDYMIYDNKVTPLDSNLLNKYLNNNLVLSYSSMDNFYHCSFKFFISNILKLDIFNTTIQTFIGNLYHFVLSKCFNEDFEFYETVKFFLENNDHPNDAKSLYFLNKVIEELEFVIKDIKYQHSLGNIDEILFEKKVCVEIPGVINTTFKGFIDKIIRHNNNIMIIDYKTYDIDIKLNLINYGLSLQLPIYLYLAKNLNKNYKVIGFYLQQILFNNFNKDKNKTVDEQKKDKLKLKGYSLGNEILLSEFDKTLNSSELIHGMKITNKGFGAYSNVLTEKEINKIISITENKIKSCIEDISAGIIEINPKIIDGKEIGCTYCKFKDICYKTNKDNVYLDKIDNLDFLEE